MSQDSQDKDPERLTENKLFLVFLGIGVILLQVVTGLAIYYALGSWTERGTFGDMFGAVNTLFSGLAFSGIIYTILLQRRELALQRRELEMTRVELERAAKAQEKQLEIMRMAQEFEEKRSFADLSPLLRANGGQRSSGTARLRIVNVGSTIRNLSMKARGDFQVSMHPMDVLRADGQGVIDFRYGSQATPPFIVTLDYIDHLGHRRRVDLECDTDAWQIKEMREVRNSDPG